MSLAEPEGEPFRFLGLDFDTKLAMGGCTRSLVHSASWKLKSILRTRRFFSDAEILQFFKCNIVSFLEYRTAGIYHAATTTLAPIDNLLNNLLRQIGMSREHAATCCNMLPLYTRRDIAMLGLIHRAILCLPPHHFWPFFRLDERDLRRTPRTVRHSKQLVETPFRLAVVNRSCLGLIRIYNRLPQEAVDAQSVKAFQSRLTSYVLSHLRSGDPLWDHLFSPRLSIIRHPIYCI